MSSAQNRRHLARKCSNIKNVVPRSNKSVSVNHSDLQRIRRKVSEVKPYTFTANTPEHQMKKCLLRSRASHQGELLTPPATPEVHLKATPSPESPTKLNIPRTLKRPPTCPVSLENLTSILPVFKNTPLPFIRDTLQAMGDPYVYSFVMFHYSPYIDFLQHATRPCWRPEHHPRCQSSSQADRYHLKQPRCWCPNPYAPDLPSHYVLVGTGVNLMGSDLYNHLIRYFVGMHVDLALDLGIDLMILSELG